MIPVLLSFMLTAQALEMEVPPPQMADHAVAIAVGEVTAAQSHWAPNTNGYIQTEVSFAVESVPKGDVPESLVLLLEGGQIGEFKTGHSDQPQLEEDHRYWVLLMKDDEGRWRPFSINGTVELQSEKAPRAPQVDEVAAVFGVNHGL